MSAPATFRRLLVTALAVALAAAASPATAKPEGHGQPRSSSVRSCRPGTETALGPATTGAPIVTGQVIEGTAYTVSRGLDPVLIAAVDLADATVTGTTEVPTGGGAWASTLSGGDLYIGTYGVADLYRFDPDTAELERVVSLDERFIFDAATAEDGTVVFGTYPNARVYAYDPDTGDLRNYGSVAPDELYVRSIDVIDGTIYAGVGSHAALVAIDADTGEMTDLLPDEVAGESFVYDLEVADDVIVAGTEPSGHLVVLDREDPSDYTIVDTGTKTVDAIAITDTTIYFTTRTDGILFAYDRASGELRELATPSPGDETRELFVRDGRLTGFAGSGAVWSYDLESGQVEVIDLIDAGHPAAPEPPQQITASDGAVHVGGHWNITRHDLFTGERTRFRMPGEPKAMVTVDGTVYAALYPSAQVWAYDADAESPDPRRVASIGESQTRPRDIAFNAATRTLAIGTRPHYGLLGGALALLDIDTGELEVHRNLIPDQSILSVATAAPESTVYVGSEIAGGIGADPVATEAHLAAWDPAADAKIWDVVPVAGAAGIRSLALAGGRLVGVTTGGMAFSVDPDTGEVLARRQLQRTMSLEATGATLYGASGDRLVRIDPLTLATRPLATDLSSDWYTGPQLATGHPCSVYVLRDRTLVRVAVHPHRGRPPHRSAQR